MKSALTIDDASSLKRNDVYDLEGAYVASVAAVQRDDRSGHFHPSAVGMCPRRNVYEYIAAPAIPTIEPEDLEIFDMGHAVHDLVQGKLSHLGTPDSPIQYEFVAEVPYDQGTDTLYCDFGIGGTCDGTMRIYTPQWEQRGVIEVKSIKDSLYEKLTKAKPDHLMQAHLYAYRYNCPIIWIWYYNKNTSRRRVFTHIFDPAILQEALERFQEQLRHVDAGTLPERDENWWMCPRCAYRDQCQPSILRKIKGKARREANKEMSSMRQRKLHRIRLKERTQ